MKRIGAECPDQLFQVALGAHARQLARHDFTARWQILGPLMTECGSVLERLLMPTPKRRVARLFGDEPLVIPGAPEQGLAGEQCAECRMIDAHAVVLAVSHDVEQRLQWRARPGDATVLEVALCHPRLAIDDRVDAGGESLRVL